MRGHVLATAILVATATAVTQPSAASQQCEALAAVEAWRVHNALVAFSDNVFGKPAIEWNDADFDFVVSIAQSCHGYSSNSGYAIRAGGWRTQMEKAREKVVPVSAAASRVALEAAALPTEVINIPPCESLLAWERDPYAFTDSSETIFGVPFLSMSSADLQAAIDFAGACLSYLPRLAEGRYGIRPDDTVRQVESLMAAVQEAAHARAAEPPAAPTDVSASIDGIEAPIAMAGSRTRRLVQAFNGAAAAGTLSGDLIAVLNREADAVIAEDRSRLDRTFAEAVKERLRRVIFGG